MEGSFLILKFVGATWQKLAIFNWYLRRHKMFLQCNFTDLNIVGDSD